MKYYCLFFLICISACEQTNKTGNKKPGDNNGSPGDIIPATRVTVNNNPVASYSVPMGDPRLDRKFGVEIYETKYTFRYLLVMQYDGMIQTDTLKLPNFDTWPVVKVKPGKEKLSCIIGFMDKKNDFREYKMLTAKNDKLKLIVLNGYVVSEY